MSRGVHVNLAWLTVSPHANVHQPRSNIALRRHGHVRLLYKNKKQKNAGQKFNKVPKRKKWREGCEEWNYRWKHSSITWVTAGMRSRDDRWQRWQTSHSAPVPGATINISQAGSLFLLEYLTFHDQTCKVLIWSEVTAEQTRVVCGRSWLHNLSGCSDELCVSQLQLDSLSAAPNFSCDHQYF